MWSLILVFGVAALIFVIGSVILVKDEGFIGILLALALACAYVGITAPIAGMVCGNNTIC